MMNGPITPKECVPFTFFEENKALYEKLIKYGIFDTLDYLLRQSETERKQEYYAFPIERIIKTIMKRNPNLESVNLVTLVKEAIPFYKEQGWNVRYCLPTQREANEEAGIGRRISPERLLFVKRNIY
jgi:hypothetical protein